MNRTTLFNHPTARRLGHRQIAFVRSWAEGVPLPAAWDRYLYVDGAGDARRARGELERLLDELRNLARNQGRHDLVVLLRRKPEAVSPGAEDPPTLEAFRNRQPPDFYPEAELLELYRTTQTNPETSGAARRHRLRRRLVAAVQWLEQVGARDPELNDPVDAWFDERVAERLRAVGIEKLGDLSAWIGRFGYHWPRRVDKVGPERAARIVRWWGEHASTLGALPAHALLPPSQARRNREAVREQPGTSAADLSAASGAGHHASPVSSQVARPGATAETPRRPETAPPDDRMVRGSGEPPRWNVGGSGPATSPSPGYDIAPLERFQPPPARDGSEGSNRAPVDRCKIAATNDHAAVQSWLRLRLPGSHTWRAYRKEAERFLLWAVIDRQKALSSLDGDDCVAYRDFLAAPHEAWTGARYVQRWSEAWRPFEGPLSPESATTAVTIVRALCEWLVRRHYLDSNPWDDVPRRPDAPTMPQLRALSQRQWSGVTQWLSALPDGPAHHRLRFLMTFGYLTGLRLSEMAATRVDWFRHEALEDGAWSWSVMVLGKRNKWREVPLPDTAVESFREYLTARQLSPHILSNSGSVPLVAQLHRSAPLSAARIYEVLVDGFKRCAADIGTRDPQAANRIRQATTHWLRHTHGSHAAALGVPQDVLQANLGHESLATTSIYVRAEKGRRHRAVQAAFGSSGTPAD